MENMKNHVSVIVPDGFVTVNNQPLFFNFTAPESMHALQWHNGAGHIEYTDNTPNKILASEDYTALVLPFVAAWEAEKNRLAELGAVPPTVEEAVQRKLAEIMAAYDAAFAPIEAVYPAKERETWAIQLAEAQNWLIDNAAQTPMLSVLIAARGMGESMADFTAKVMENNAQYRLLAGSLTGQQQRMYRDVNSMATAPGITTAEIMAYPVNYALPEGLTYGM